MVEHRGLTSEGRLEPRDFVETSYSIQYQLLSSGSVQDLTDGSLINDNDEPAEAFRLAAIVYMKAILRDFTVSATGCRILVSKLKTTLSLVSVSEIAPSLLLWILFMGGVASAEDSSYRSYFNAHLVKLQHGLCLKEWGDVKKRLQDVLWVGKVFDEPGSALWEEVRSVGLTLVT